MPPGVRVIAFDLLGFGEADKPYDFSYELEPSGRILNRILRELGVDRAHLVAHDIGGVVGLETAVQDPAQEDDRLARLARAGLDHGRLVEVREPHAVADEAGRQLDRRRVGAGGVLRVVLRVRGVA